MAIGRFLFLFFMMHATTNVVNSVTPQLLEVPLTTRQPTEFLS